MAEVKQYICDVYGINKGVKTYCVDFYAIDTITGERLEEPSEYMVRVDLCPRAVARAMKYLENAVSPPTPGRGRKAANKEEQS